MAVTGSAAGLGDLLRSTFNEYCKVPVGKARLLYDPSAPKMTQAQYLLLCQDIGILEPEGGNLTAASIAVIFASYKQVNHQAMPFHYFVRSLSALATAARTNVHQMVADLAGHIPHTPSVTRVGKIRPHSALQRSAGGAGAALPYSRSSFPGVPEGPDAGWPQQQADMPMSASVDVLWTPAYAGNGPGTAGSDGSRNRFSEMNVSGGFARNQIPRPSSAYSTRAPGFNGALTHSGGLDLYGSISPGAPTGAFHTPASGPFNGGPYANGGAGHGGGVYSPGRASSGGGFYPNGALSPNGLDGVSLGTADAAASLRGSEIPAWAREEGMPVWLSSLMKRLDSLDAHFGWSEGANLRGSGQAATGTPEAPGARGRGQAGPALQQASSSPAAAAVPSQAAQLSELSQEVAELKQAALDVKQQMHELSSRAQRVEAQLAALPAGSSEPRGGDQDRQAELEASVRSVQADVQDLKQAWRSREQESRREQQQQQQQQQQQEQRLQQLQQQQQQEQQQQEQRLQQLQQQQQEQQQVQGGADTSRLENLERLVRSQQEEMQNMGSVISKLLEVTNVLQEREESKQEIFRGMLVKQGSIRGGLGRSESRGRMSLAGREALAAPGAGELAGNPAMPT